MKYCVSVIRHSQVKYYNPDDVIATIDECGNILMTDEFPSEYIDFLMPPTMTRVPDQQRKEIFDLCNLYSQDKITIDELIRTGTEVLFRGTKYYFTEKDLIALKPR